jgi:triphosphoribosyl-dephospho-CoA synthase
VARKFGPAEAEALRREACVHAEAARRSGDTRPMRGQLQAWDATLKARALNPGTSADLTVATLFASGLLAADW